MAALVMEPLLLGCLYRIWAPDSEFWELPYEVCAAAVGPAGPAVIVLARFATGYDTGTRQAPKADCAVFGGFHIPKI